MLRCKEMEALNATPFSGSIYMSIKFQIDEKIFCKNVHPLTRQNSHTQILHNKQVIPTLLLEHTTTRYVEMKTQNSCSFTYRALC